MAAYSSILAWKIPWTEELGRLQSMGSLSHWTRLSSFTFTFPFHAWEKEMATHSSVLAWKIPGMAEPGGLPSTGSHRVGHDWRDLAAAAAYPLLSFIVVQLWTFAWFFSTPWTEAFQASLSFTISWSLLKLMWCHPTISSSVALFSSYPQSFPASGSFPVSWLFASGGQRIVSPSSAPDLSVTIQGWFPLGLTDLIFLQSKGLSRVFSSTTVQKHHQLTFSWTF